MINSDIYDGFMEDRVENNLRRICKDREGVSTGV